MDYNNKGVVTYIYKFIVLHIRKEHKDGHLNICNILGKVT